MAQARGSKGRIFYCEESSWGVTPGSPTVKQLKAVTYGESLGTTGEEQRSNSITGQRGIEAVRLGNIDAGGSLPFEASALHLGTLIKHALGGKTTTGTGPYTHTLKRSTLPAGLTIEKNFSDVDKTFRFTGAKIDRLQLSFSPQGLVTGVMDFMAKDAAVPGTALTPSSAITHDPFRHVDVDTYIDGSAVCMLGFTCDITNNLDRQRCVGDRYIDELPEGQGACSGTMTLKFAAETYFSGWLAETDYALKLVMTKGAHSHELLVPKARLQGDAMPKLATAGGIIYSLNWTAIYDSTTSTDVQYKIISSESSI